MSKLCSSESSDSHLDWQFGLVLSKDLTSCSVKSLDLLSVSCCLCHLNFYVPGLFIDLTFYLLICFTGCSFFSGLTHWMLLLTHLSFDSHLRAETYLQFMTNVFPLRRVPKVNPRKRSQFLEPGELLQVPLFQNVKHIIVFS